MGRRPKQKTVVESAMIGTQLELLRAMRTRIAGAVQDESTPARDLAALTKRLGDVAREIAALEVQEREEAKSAYEAEDGDFNAETI